MDCEFIAADILNHSLPTNNDVVIFPYSIFNLFKIKDANLLLENVNKVLKPQGIFYFEAMQYLPPEKQTHTIKAWRSSGDNFFCPEQHIIVAEENWNEKKQCQKGKYFFVKLNDMSVEQHTNRIYFYNEQQYRDLLSNAGFDFIQFFDAPPGVEQDEISYIFMLAIKK